MAKQATALQKANKAFYGYYIPNICLFHSGAHTAIDSVFSCFNRHHYDSVRLQSFLPEPGYRQVRQEPAQYPVP